MKGFTIAFAAIHLTTLSLAAPLEVLIEERQFLASITFYGAGPGGQSFFQQFPADDQLHNISKHPTFLQSQKVLRPAATYVVTRRCFSLHGAI